MKKLILLATFVLFNSTYSYAHVQLGNYEGVNQEGKSCFFKVLAVNFVDNVKEPLNERVEIQVDVQKFTLQHLPQINLETAEVAFDHDHLTGVVATSIARVAVVLTMDHTPGRDGPATLNVIFFDKKSPENSLTVACSGLRFIGL